MADFTVKIREQRSVSDTFEAIVEAFAGISIEVDSAGALYCKECGIELNWDHNQRAADEKIVADPEASAEAKRNAQARLDAMKNLAYTTKAGRFTFAYSGFNADGPGHFTAKGFKGVRGKDKIPSMRWSPSASVLTPSAPNAAAQLTINEECPMIGELRITVADSASATIRANAAERSATAAKTTFADNSPARAHAVADFERTRYDETTLEPIVDSVTLSADWTVYAFEGEEKWTDTEETRWVETANTTTGTPHQVRWVRASPPLPTGPIPWTGGVFHYGWEHVVTAYAVDKLQIKQVSDRGRERWVDADPAQTRQGRMIGPVVEGRFSGSFSARENSKGDQGPYTIFPGCDDGCEEIKVYQSAPSPGMHPSPDPPEAPDDGWGGGGGGGSWEWDTGDDSGDDSGDDDSDDEEGGSESGPGGTPKPPPEANGDGENCPHGHAFKAVPAEIAVPREAKSYRVRLSDPAPHGEIVMISHSGCVKATNLDGSFSVAFTDAGDDDGGVAVWRCDDGCTASCTVRLDTGEEGAEPDEPDDPDNPDGGEGGTGGGTVGGGTTAPISPTADVFTLAAGAPAFAISTRAEASRLTLTCSTNAAEIFLETTGADFVDAELADADRRGTAGELRTFPITVAIAANTTDTARAATLRLRIAQAGFDARRTVECAITITQAAAGAPLPDKPSEPDEPDKPVDPDDPDTPGTGGGEEDPDEPDNPPAPPSQPPRIIATPDSLAFPASGGEAELTLEVVPDDGVNIASARLFIPAAMADVFRAEAAVVDAATGTARFRIHCADAGSRFAPAQECAFIASVEGVADAVLIPASRAAGDAAALRDAARTYLGADRCAVFVDGKRAAFFPKK